MRRELSPKLPEPADRSSEADSGASSSEPTSTGAALSPGSPAHGAADVLTNSSRAPGRAGAWEMDASTEALTCSTEFHALTGRAPGVGYVSIRDFSALVHGDDCAAFHHCITKAREEGGSHRVEFRFRHPDGIARRFVWTSNSVVGPGGPVIRLFGTLEDVSDWRRSEERIRNQAQQLALAAETAGIGTWEWDIHSHLVRWDDRMFVLYGQPARECLTYDSWISCIHPEDLSKAERLMRAVARPESPGAFEFRIIRGSDGAVRTLRAAARMVRDGEGRGTRVVGVNMDVTERRLAERELARVQAERESARLYPVDAGSGDPSPASVHDFGRVISSVNVSANVLLRILRDSRAASLGKVVGLLQEHERDLGHYLSADPRGRQIPEYLARLAEQVLAERETISRELASLQATLDLFNRNLIPFCRVVPRQGGSTEAMS